MASLFASSSISQASSARRYCVELVGPSLSAKLIPHSGCNQLHSSKRVEWGSLWWIGRLVMFLDLDCRFDVSCLAQLLKHRIIQANGSSSKVHSEQNDGGLWTCHAKKKSSIAYDEELFALCLRRFLYVRCYDSYEFLATLKTLRFWLQKEREACGISVHFLMIDRKSLSLQSVSKTVVQEMRKLLLVHPMVVIATKAIIIGDKNSAKEVKCFKLETVPPDRKLRKLSTPDTSYADNVKSNTQHVPYYEYMPSVWQGDWNISGAWMQYQPSGERSDIEEKNSVISLRFAKSKLHIAVTSEYEKPTCTE
ncbi:hypothetical protein EZV62_027933 [Acer yangbiense]|uniref:Uncharacterized protein n=1 Tax=Acer yangbiense TaxID=1000413 RepID=A0A5C7GP18_9ROSI|nr:hypothetical protein EZV62_027933 [Acer yangbiense]